MAGHLEVEKTTVSTEQRPSTKAVRLFPGSAIFPIASAGGRDSLSPGAPLPSSHGGLKLRAP